MNTYFRSLKKALLVGLLQPTGIDYLYHVENSNAITDLYISDKSNAKVPTKLEGYNLTVLGPLTFIENTDVETVSFQGMNLTEIQ